MVVFCSVEETDVKAGLQSDSTFASRYKFAIEHIEDCWFEALPLIYANQMETGSFDPDKFTPPRDLYVKADQLGKIVLYTMRDAVVGNLVGYQVFMLSDHPRYRDIRVGVQDVAYVLPEHRGPAVLTFFQFADFDLQSRGLKPMRHSSGKKDITSLLAHLGYKLAESTWIKD